MLFSYAALKYAHMACAGLSIVVFALRGLAVLAGWSVGNHAYAKQLAIAADTCLLVFGIWLVLLLGLNPVVVPWLGLKLVLLVVYIVLGLYALKKASSWRGKLWCYLGALATVIWIFGIARAHHPLGWLKLL